MAHSKSITLEVQGKKRIIRNIRTFTPWVFFAYYKGCSISISEYGDDGRSWDLTVCGKDGCYLVNTYESKATHSRIDLMKMAIRNIV